MLPFPPSFSSPVSARPRCHKSKAQLGKKKIKEGEGVEKSGDAVSSAHLLGLPPLPACYFFPEQLLSRGAWREGNGRRRRRSPVLFVRRHLLLLLLLLRAPPISEKKFFDIGKEDVHYSFRRSRRPFFLLFSPPAKGREKTPHLTWY